jgi:hypothetical protein
MEQKALQLAKAGSRRGLCRSLAATQNEKETSGGPSDISTNAIGACTSRNKGSARRGIESEKIRHYFIDEWYVCGGKLKNMQNLKT